MAGSPDPASRLLCVSQSFAPETTPTGIRAGKLVEQLANRWDVSLLTETRQAASSGAVRVTVARSRRPRKLIATLRRLRMSKLLELLIWPDDAIFWVLPAIFAGRKLIRQRRPSAIVVFMMPYSAGLVGLVLSRLSGIPLILNLDDSPTCTDMHPDFPSRFHFRLARALEDLYARRADAVVYVSQENLEKVRARQPAGVGEKFHLVRYGADASSFQPRAFAGERFEIVYVGAMSGWWTLIERHSPASRGKRLYDAWMRLGRYSLTELDTSTASPAVVGEALAEAIAQNPQWDGLLGMTVYDNSYPRAVVERALAAAGIDRVVGVHDAIPHAEVATVLSGADLLFLTLPRRVDDSRGGRISAKTYEYLMTDRPILAALPPGENWDYLDGKPGVWLTAPDDAKRQRDVIVELAAAKFAGQPRRFARTRVHEEIAYTARAGEFEAAIGAAIEHARRRRAD
jgi:hypothetical protein